MAVSAIIRALDWPPLKAVIWVSILNCSPASLLASSIILSTVWSISSTILDLACNSRKSLTDRSITKFMFCDSWATSLLFEENLHFLSGYSPFIIIVLLVGVSHWAVHSMSAKSLDLPEPVGPTIAIISDFFISNLSKPSLLPDLSWPGIIVNTSTVLASSIPKKDFICLMYSTRSIVILLRSRAISSTSSSEKWSKNSIKVLSSKPATSNLFSSK